MQGQCLQVSSWNIRCTFIQRSRIEHSHKGRGRAISPRRKRYEIRRWKRRLRRAVLVLSLVLVPVLSFAWLDNAQHSLAAMGTVVADGPNEPEEIKLPPAALKKIEGRAIYRYSLIPGGIRSIDDLRAALEADGVLAEHYAGFDLAHASMATLDHDIWAYVSYRTVDGIFWTTKLVLLKSGEQVVSDGEHLARARCGNRISWLLERRTPPKAPDPEDMDYPVNFLEPLTNSGTPPLVLLPGISVIPPAPKTAPPTYVPPAYYGGAGTPPLHISAGSPNGVPLLSILCGLLMIMCLRSRVIRKR